MLNIRQVENVFVFAADSLRDDYLPPEVAAMGTKIRMIASSLSSPGSFASIATGLSPSRNGVNKWADRLSAPTVFEREDINTSFWDRSGTLRIVLREPPKISLGEIEPPFFYFERDLLTHMPYNRSDKGSRHYFRTRGTSIRQLKEDYEASTRDSLAKFMSRIDVLKERGLLENTLVVFTSDHGELLGEYGLVGHNSPACPELIVVPSVWIHPDLPQGETRDDILMSHVDILPTALGAMGRKSSIPLDGYNLLAHSGREQAYCEKSSRFYSVASLWDKKGGQVFRKSGLLYGMLHAVARTMAPDWTCVRFALNSSGFLPLFLQRHQVFGSPEFSAETAEEMIEELESRERFETTDVELDDEIIQRLRSLGYFEN